MATDEELAAQLKQLFAVNGCAARVWGTEETPLFSVKSAFELLLRVKNGSSIWHIVKQKCEIEPPTYAGQVERWISVSKRFLVFAVEDADELDRVASLERATGNPVWKGCPFVCVSTGAGRGSPATSLPFLRRLLTHTQDKAPDLQRCPELLFTVTGLTRPETPFASAASTPLGRRRTRTMAEDEDSDHEDKVRLPEVCNPSRSDLTLQQVSKRRWSAEAEIQLEIERIKAETERIKATEETERVKATAEAERVKAMAELVKAMGNVGEDTLRMVLGKM